MIRKEFVPNYEVWNYHGEEARVSVQFDPPVKRRRKHKHVKESEHHHTGEFHAGCEQMVHEVAGAEFMGASNVSEGDDFEESPNPDAQLFYDMLASAKKPIWPGCTTHTELSLISRLMSIKAEGNMSESSFNNVTQLLSEVCPTENEVPKKFYEAAKKMRGMGLPMKTIDCCPNMCMIYWEDDADLLTCKFCGNDRYKRYKKGASNKRQKKNLPP